MCAFPAIPDPPQLSVEEQRFLGMMAARALRDLCVRSPEESPSVKPPAGAEPAPAGTARTCGVFVTLYCEDDLRGCLGATSGREPLFASVPRLSRAAGSRDVRFEPIRGEELAYLRIEITLLCELTPLPKDPDEVVHGLCPAIHGVHLRRGGTTGLLLPQVARRLGWDALELLRQVSLKAKLPADAWRHPAVDLSAFRVRSFRVDSSGGLLRAGGDENEESEAGPGPTGGSSAG